MHITTTAERLSEPRTLYVGSASKYWALLTKMFRMADDHEGYATVPIGGVASSMVLDE
jgi:hypothetical protein